MFSCSPPAPPASQHVFFLVARDPARGGTLFAHRFMRLPPELIPTTPEPFVEAFLRSNGNGTMGCQDWDQIKRISICYVYCVYIYIETHQLYIPVIAQFLNKYYNYIHTFIIYILYKRFKGWKNEMWEAKRETAKSQFLGVQTQTRQSSLHLLHKKLKSLKGQSWWELGYNCLLYELPFHVWKHSWLVCAVGSIHCLLSIMSKVTTSNSWCQPTDEHKQNLGYKTGNLQLVSTSEPCGWFILTQ